MKRSFGPIAVVIVVVLVALRMTFFTVDATQQAIVVELGKPVTGALGPGLHVKIPFVQEAIVFEKRLLDYDAAPAEILTKDKKNLVVDNYAKWRITDPLRFYKTVKSVSGAQARLDDIIFAEVRVELGRHLMIEAISKSRSDIMEAVSVRANEKTKDLGIEVVDVRIKRADLPQENARAVFGRMQAERKREANRYRSEGEEAALKIRADADRQRTIILAEAYRQSQEIKGEGDAQATAIFAEAFGQDPAFFDFMRTLESYRKSLDENTTLVVSPDDEYLRFIKGSVTTDAPAPTADAAPKAPPVQAPAEAAPAPAPLAAQ